MTNGAFLRFVEDGGYDERRLLARRRRRLAAAAGRRPSAALAPRRGGRWQARWFDRWQPLAPTAPVVHVNAWEAEAYCRWAKRRLPSAAEWECAARDPRFAGAAASGNGPPTLSSPYPGFAAGPYADYSRPWFGDHRELRGGSFATHVAAASSGVPQLLHAGAQRRVRRLSHRRPSNLRPEHRHGHPSHPSRRLRARAAARLRRPPPAAQVPGVLRVSAIPDEAPTELQRKFKPLGDYLKKETGHGGAVHSGHRLRGRRRGPGHQQARPRLARRLHLRAGQAAHQRRRGADRAARRGREVHQPLHRADRQHGARPSPT